MQTTIKAPRSRARMSVADDDDQGEGDHGPCDEVEHANDPTLQR